MKKYVEDKLSECSFHYSAPGHPITEYTDDSSEYSFENGSGIHSDDSQAAGGKKGAKIKRDDKQYLESDSDESSSMDEATIASSQYNFSMYSKFSEKEAFKRKLLSNENCYQILCSKNCKKVNKIQIDDMQELGRGGQSVVYMSEITFEKQNTIVANKIFTQQKIQNVQNQEELDDLEQQKIKNALKQGLREFLIASHLNHKNIIKYMYFIKNIE